MPKLTKAFIEQIEPVATGQAIYRDSELIGFALRVTARSKTFIVEKRVNGKNYRFSIGRYGVISISDARSKARILLADMSKGIAPGESNQLPTTITLREAFDKYLEVHPLSKKTIKYYKYSVEKCLDDWLDMPFMSITRDMVEQRHQTLTTAPTRLGTSGHARANQALHTLKSVLKFASERYSEDGEPLIKFNPVDRLTINRQWHRRIVRHGVVPEMKLSAWYRAVCEIEYESIREYFLFVLLTGMRKTEAASLKWCDVDFELAIIKIPKEITKTRNAYSIPLSQFIKTMLERRLMKNNSVYIFCSIKYPTKPLACMDQVIPQMRAACGYYFQIHDLRRTYLTMGAKLDVPFYILKSLVNHKLNEDITDRYLVVNTDAQRRYVEKITDEFVKLMAADLNSAPFATSATSGDALAEQLSVLTDQSTLR